MQAIWAHLLVVVPQSLLVHFFQLKAHSGSLQGEPTLLISHS